MYSCLKDFITSLRPHGILLSRFQLYR